MTRSSTGILKSLCVGFLMALAVLASYAPGIHATEIERAAVSAALYEEVGVQVWVDGLCRDHEPKKHRCKHIARATATFIDSTAKRKQGEDAVSLDGPQPCALCSAVVLIRTSYTDHLRLSFDTVYATTRRMHI